MSPGRSSTVMMRSSFESSSVSWMSSLSFCTETARLFVGSRLACWLEGLSLSEVAEEGPGDAAPFFEEPLAMLVQALSLCWCGRRLRARLEVRECYSGIVRILRRRIEILDDPRSGLDVATLRAELRAAVSMLQNREDRIASLRRQVVDLGGRPDEGYLESW